jgi:hypothetical protein
MELYKQDWKAVNQPNHWVPMRRYSRFVIVFELVMANMRSTVLFVDIFVLDINPFLMNVDLDWVYIYNFTICHQECLHWCR